MKRHSSHWNETAAAEARSVGRWFTAARREGLLAGLEPEDWHTLSAIVSFTGRDGERRFTLEQLALALGASRETARSRLERLQRALWKEHPLLRLQTDEAGEVSGAELAPLEVLLRVETGVQTGAEPSHSEPRSEPQLTAVPAASTAGEPGATLAERLEALGLTPGQVERLLADYPPDRVERQLRWLPARGARNPAAMLIRAVEADWEAPKGAA